MSKPVRVLTLVEFYLPGFRAGGPLRTISNMVDGLRDRVDFRIFTRDRDVGAVSPYPGVRVDSWNAVKGAQVYYASPETVRSLNPRTLGRIIETAWPDVVYLNSFFAPMTLRFLAWRRAGLMPKVPVILAPRGELSVGALRLGSWRKQAFIRAVRELRLYEGILWQASSRLEEKEIQLVMGPGVGVQVAPDMLSTMTAAPPGPKKKRAGSARFVFISRITPKKNLRFAIESFAELRTGSATLDAYGSVGDLDYMRECEVVARGLPPNVEFAYRGEVPHERVLEVLRDYHFFLLPTLGENFGHAIIEAMQAGCAPMISDQTPWLGLEGERAGWDLPLRRELWSARISACLGMDSEEHAGFSRGAWDYARRWCSRPELAEQNIALFQPFQQPCER